jgi:hypothetical protein
MALVALAVVVATGGVVVIDDFGRQVDRAVLATLQNFASRSPRFDPPPVDESGVGVLDLNTADMHQMCCGEVGQLLRLIGLPVLIGGIPMALTALILLRERGPARTTPGRLVVRAFFVLQSVSCCLWTIGFIGMSLSPSDVILGFEGPGYLVIAGVYATVLGHMFIGALGARAWWRLSSQPPEMVTLLAET